jgi:hypothetical protein
MADDLYLTIHSSTMGSGANETKKEDENGKEG